MTSDADAQTPRALHPIFFGSFDWHSCVHGWWTLLTMRRLFPDIPEAAAIDELANSSFTVAKVQVERAYLDRPSSRGFERPYGWAWLLHLHLEAARHDRDWADALEPLARALRRAVARLSRNPDIPDPRRNALQHGVRNHSVTGVRSGFRPRSRRPFAATIARLVRRGP